MKLHTYLKRENLKLGDFALRIGVSHAAVSRYLTGHRRPNWEVLDRIEQATAGEVTANDFVRAA